MRYALKLKAWCLLSVMLFDIVFSNLFALSSGPSQPEMANFSPAGMNDMVDPFSGDFSYNIDLFDIEGYPVNLSYSSGVTMEQEASWVGLGWNLNVGSINRSVRGIPDDFNGESIVTETNVKDMTIVKVGGAIVGEVFGFGRGSAGLSFIHNNYKGFGLALDGSLGASAGPVNASVGLTMNSLDGTSVNSNLGVSLQTSQGKMGSLSFGANLGTGFNTRTGQTMLSLGTTAGYTSPAKKPGILKAGGHTKVGLGSSSTSLLPIGMDTYTPFPSLRFSTNTVDFSGTIGGSLFGVHPGGRVFGSISKQSLIDRNVSTPAYGYMFTENAGPSSIKDFNREKNIALNETIENLSPTNFTYDVFSVTGQGVSGMFRPFRNDVGLLSDPAYSVNSATSNSFGIEIGAGNIFHGGGTFNRVDVDVSYGKWTSSNSASTYSFQEEASRGVYEKVYFKSAGDLSESDNEYFNNNGQYDAYAFDLSSGSINNLLVGARGGNLNGIYLKSNSKRDARSKVLQILSAQKATNYNLEPITSTSGAFYDDNEDGFNEAVINRVDGIQRKAHHISEITQINADGERFVFGIPAYNYFKEEVTYNTTQKTQGTQQIEHEGNNAKSSNSQGVDHYYSSTKTPSYAHSFLLTAKLSSDYQDVKGDGITPDDIGSAHKFTYTRKSNAYHWRTPYNKDSYMEGYKSNHLDQKASFSYGTKELWYLHTIQSKTQIAEFYISKRDDAFGASGRSGGKADTSITSAYSWQLDSIVLFNKIDRLKNKEKAFPIKKIEFEYDYSLCQGIPNSISNQGKLTLKKLYISYGNSETGKDSPYIFEYSTENPTYNASNSDRWGNYKDATYNPISGFTNGDFPYTLQNNESIQDQWASAWSLVKITTPEGGKLNIEYESDDYGFVQDRQAMQMYPIIGSGTNGSIDPNNLNTSLYGRRFLFFERPSTIPNDLDKETLKRLFLGENGSMQNMYFKFLTSIGSKYDYASGYTRAVDLNYCSNNSNYLYVEVQSTSPNPISRTAWGFFRQNLFEVLYQQPNVSNTGVESVIRGIQANINDIKQMFSGVESHMISRNIGNVFTPKKSFVRLFNADFDKEGGGSRVKRIYINDNWKNISGEGENSIYGQEYYYTTNDFLGREISSGVASYEPMIGNDENPFREPVWYTSARGQGHIPAIEAFQEKPFGETFFPTATVGYSKVVVRNINYEGGITSNSITEHKFYTAKEFPVIVDQTKIQIENNPAGRTRFTFPISNNTNKSSFAASQGYSIVLNDMHGKLISTNNYLLANVEEDGKSYFIKKLNSGVKYNYRVKSNTNGLALNNIVETIGANNVVESKLLGTEVDIALENRRTYESNQSTALHANLDIFIIPLGFIPIGPIIIPTAGYNRVKDIKESKYQVVTKVVQQYGIVESVEKYNDQYKQIVSNELYDGTTGEVILTKTKDEYNRDEYQFDLPAYMVSGQELMGPTYETIGLKVSISPKPIDINCNNDNSAFFPESPSLINHGDEVIAYRTNGTEERAWVYLDQDNSFRRPIFTCDTDSVVTPFTAKYRRLLTMNGRQAQSVYDSAKTSQKDSIGQVIQGRFKKQFGELLEEVKIYHLNHDISKELDSLYSIHNDPIVNLNVCEVASVPSFGIQHEINHAYHSTRCSTSSRYYTLMDKYSTNSQKWFKQGTQFDLTEKFDTSFSVQLNDYFNLEDTMIASIELLEAKEYKDSISIITPLWWYNNNNVLHVPITKYNHTYDSSYYRIAYNTCSSFDDYYDFFYEQDGSFGGIEEVDPSVNGHISTLFTGSAQSDTNSWPTYDDTLTTNKLRKSSKSSLRIEDKASFHPFFEREGQVYLIEYQHRNKLTGDTSQHLYIEFGRAYNFVPWQVQPKSAYCLAEDSAWANRNDSSETISDNQVCVDNYRLMDRNGNFLNVSNISKIEVFRPAKRNLLTLKTGSVVTQSSPIKLDRNGENKFAGLNVTSQNKLLSARAQKYTDSTSLYWTHPTSNNPFLNGSEGVFRPDSLFEYLGKRSQNENVETPKDGYLAELPSLWTDLSCYRGIFPPNYVHGGSSSGWRFVSSPTKYSSSNIPLESISNLNIYSSNGIKNENKIIASSPNSKHSNVAFDGFEDYYHFGYPNLENTSGFRFLQSISGSTNNYTLLNESETKYSYKEIDDSRLVKGVSHTGEFSLFLNEKDNTDSTSLKISYKENTIDHLQQYVISEKYLSEVKEITVNESNEKTRHYNAFKSNLSSSAIDQLDNARNNAPESISFFLSSGDSVAHFKPEKGEYVLSLWIKELLASGTPYVGSSSLVRIISNGSTTNYNVDGPVIDGWQRLEANFKYDPTEDFEIIIDGGEWGAFIDDIRIYPKQSNVKTYVYDHYKNRLDAVLDENNYAVFYEYDQAGIPTQVKRETSEGILTISESRQSKNKHN